MLSNKTQAHPELLSVVGGGVWPA